MKMLFEAKVRCKDPNCKMYDRWQTIRFKRLSDFFDKSENNKYRKCHYCQNTDVTYTNATKVYLGMTVREAIQALSKLDTDSILTIDIPYPTCDNGTCFDYNTNYIYEIFQVDGKDEVKVLFSPDKN